MPGGAKAMAVLAGALCGCGSLPLDLDSPSGSGRYHPVGWAMPALHGPALKGQTDNCRLCHGGDLGGGSVGVGCDSCHPAGWRTNCTFCHGGVDNDLGSPPRDLSGETDPTRLSFGAHTVHVTERTHPAFDCTQCHVKPSDVLSPGHVFDDTPGRAEVVFGGGLSAAGAYDGTTCSSLYCHGNGRGANGTYDKHGPTPTCGGCHPDQSSGSSAWATMSGRHARHLDQGIACYECHGAVVNQAADTILDPTLHVNGQPDLLFTTSSITYAGGGCSGICHGEGHEGERW